MPYTYSGTWGPGGVTTTGPEGRQSYRRTKKSGWQPIKPISPMRSVSSGYGTDIPISPGDWRTQTQPKWRTEQDDKDKKHLESLRRMTQQEIGKGQFGGMAQGGPTKGFAFGGFGAGAPSAFAGMGGFGTNLRGFGTTQGGGVGGGTGFAGARERDRLLRQTLANQQQRRYDIEGTYGTALERTLADPNRALYEESARSELAAPGMTAEEEQMLKSRFGDIAGLREVAERKQAARSAGRRGTVGGALQGIESEAAGRRTTALLGAEGAVSIEALRTRREGRRGARGDLMRLYQSDTNAQNRWAQGVAGAIAGVNPNFEWEQEEPLLNSVIAGAADPGGPDYSYSIGMLGRIAGQIAEQTGDDYLSGLVQQLMTGGF